MYNLRDVADRIAGVLVYELALGMATPMIRPCEACLAAIRGGKGIKGEESEHSGAGAGAGAGA